MFTLIFATLLATSPATLDPSVEVSCDTRTVAATMAAAEPGWGFSVQGEPPQSMNPGEALIQVEPINVDGSFTVVAWQQGTGLEWGGTFQSECGPLVASEPEVPVTSSVAPVARPLPAPVRVASVSPVATEGSLLAFQNAVRSFVDACIAMAGFAW